MCEIEFSLVIARSVLCNEAICTFMLRTQQIGVAEFRIASVASETHIKT